MICLARKADHRFVAVTMPATSIMWSVSQRPARAPLMAVAYHIRCSRSRSPLLESSLAIAFHHHSPGGLAPGV
jgi:hypothetical protein